MTDYDIHVHHLTRVEGHGDVLLKVKDNKVEHIAFNVVEAPRFFEAMLVGRAHYEVREIVTRICGICACGHALSSLRASEAAMSIEPSDQTVTMRKLVLHGENLSSHYLHYYFLAAPDFLGVGSVLPLAATHPDVVVRALRLKKLGNDLAEAFVGRHVHPISMKINGFSKLPDPAVLKSVQNRLVESIKDLDATLDLFATLKVPDYTRETEYVSLGPINGSKEYPFYDGNIISSNGDSLPPLKYTEITNEVCHPDSTAKYCAHNGKPYQVGALARFNNNYDLLRPEAKKAAEKLGIKPVCNNPYMITVAQIVETVHITYDAIDLISKLLADGLKDEPVEYKVKAGAGAGAVEVPRGILFHGYTYDNNGYITKADCVIPTTQNVANINDDFRAFVPKMLGKPESEISLLLQMLVRAYDPCISCSAHLLDVRVERE
jgi:coenzyme F420-reducing hydrogenase alpha subunit